MTINGLLQSVCEMLRRCTGTAVSLGPPDTNSSGVFVWPWKIDENRVRRSVPRAKGPGGAERLQAHPATDVHFLVVVHPAFSAEGLALLDTVDRCLFENPVIASDRGQAQLVTETLPVEALASLFLSVGLPVTACVCVQAIAIDTETSPTEPLDGTGGVF